MQFQLNPYPTNSHLVHARHKYDYQHGFPLPLAIQRFNQRANEVHIQIEVKPSLELEQSVLHGRLNAAIGLYPLPISGLYYHPLFEKKSISTVLMAIFFQGYQASI